MLKRVLGAVQRLGNATKKRCCLRQPAKYMCKHVNDYFHPYSAITALTISLCNSSAPSPLHMIAIPFPV